MKTRLTFNQLKRLLKESGDRDDLTRFGRRDDATISVSNIKWDSDDDSLPTSVKLCVPYIGCISDDDGNTIEEKRTGYIEEVEHALHGHYNTWPEDFDFFVDDYGPCATLDESKKESTSGIERNLAKVNRGVKKFNALRKQALDKIGDEDSLYYETGSTIQSGPQYVSEMQMEMDDETVTVTWVEEEMLGWKTRRVAQENKAKADDEFEIDNLIESIQYMAKGVKKALKYYEKLNPDNEEEVLADLENDEADEATELTVKEGTGEPSDELLISEFTAEWIASGLNNLDNMMDCMDRGADSDKRKCWMRLGRRLREIADMCDENARRVWARPSEVMESKDDWEWCVIKDTPKSGKFDSALYYNENAPIDGDVTAVRKRNGWEGHCRFMNKRDAMKCAALMTAKAKRNYNPIGMAPPLSGYRAVSREFWEENGRTDRDIDAALWDADSRY